MGADLELFYTTCHPEHSEESLCNTLSLALSYRTDVRYLYILRSLVVALYREQYCNFKYYLCVACHLERSEGTEEKILRYTQNDKTKFCYRRVHQRLVARSMDENHAVRVAKK